MILINSSPKNALGIFQPFLPISIPMGVGYIAAFLQEQGVHCEIVDEQVESDPLAKIETLVSKLAKPYIFGFSVLTATFKSALELSARLKEKYPDSVIIFGGIHPTAMPDEVLSHEFVDIVVRGEGENVIKELYDRLKAGKPVDNIDSVSFRKDGGIVHNKICGIISDIDRLPPFPYHLFADNPRYDLGFVMSSRGCPYDCIFCSNRVTTKKGYRYRSSGKVVADIEQLYVKYGRTKVTFFDDNFLVNKDRIFQLTSEIRNKGLHEKMTFGFQGRGDNTTEELMKELYSTGFTSVFFGIETASNRLLKLIKKGETIEQIINAVEIAKRIGFHVSATFIYALPTETHKDRMESLALSKKLNLDMVRYNNATPYPGTELYQIALNADRLKIQGVYDNFISVSTFIESPFDKIPFTYVPEGNTEAGIRKDLLFSYLSFYFDFKKIKQVFFNPEKGVSWFDAKGSGLFSFIGKLPALGILGLMMCMKYLELFASVLFQFRTDITRREFLTVFTEFFGA
jgi:anaerobic magnesium-protoporphyrin IX monomethyl ester cyclase